VTRKTDGRYQFELTEPLTPPRDQDGKIDAAGTMQLVTSTVESWVREHPEQWMWTHRRWR
jgi:KDO2-lipid IV(A) lauroyltransferase